MSQALVHADIAGYLQQHEQKTLLRFITCGSVDDGKSTLIGRLLYEAKVLCEDQLAAVHADSRRWGTQRGEPDFALLVDGLAAEREQGITIDVAYRFFTTERRKFIVADTPGHEQYTRNMITGASTADVAVILVDARKGVLTQTRRHSYLVSLIGIRRVLLAVNKMDLVNYAEPVFRAIVDEYTAFARQLGPLDITAIPLSALKGENVVVHGDSMPWYRGPALMEYLETVEVDSNSARHQGFRFPVQWVNRPDAEFRGYAGTVSGSVLRRGDRIRVQPAGRESTVARIVTHDGDLDEALPGQAVTLTLTEEIDVSRGDLLADAAAPADTADRIEATLVWMEEQPLSCGQSYLLQIGSSSAIATATAVRYKVDVNTLERQEAGGLVMNEIGLCELDIDRPLAFDPYESNSETGGFILIDRHSNNTVAAGMIHRGLDRVDSVQQKLQEVDRTARASLKGQQPCVVWFTGSDRSGLAAVARLLESLLHAMGRHTFLLEGDKLGGVRNRAAGRDGAEGGRQLAEMAGMMADAGLIVLVTASSQDGELLARRLLPPDELLAVRIGTRDDEAGVGYVAREQRELRLAAMDKTEIGQAADAVVRKLVELDVIGIA